MSAPPTKRQKLKTTTACEPCRSRKIRCDGNKPSCEACLKRSQQCIYQATPDTKSANAYVDSLVNRVSQLEQELNNARNTILRLSTAPITPAPPPPPPTLSSNPDSNIDPRLLPGHGAPSMEVGSVDAMGGDAGFEDHPNGGQPFYGSSSAHGFTRQMYGTILQKDNASTTPEIPIDPSLTEPISTQSASTAPYTGPESFSLLPRELADRLMHLYWDRVHVLYPFLHKVSFSQAYEDLWRPTSQHHPRHTPGLGLGASREAGPSSVIFHCAFNAALALGMQFSDLPLDEKERLSASCVAKSKDLLKLDLFDDGNIALIQTLLLLTQYFQSTNWPSKCWTSIGLACRLAQGLGLHIEEDRFEQQFSASNREMRRRVWHGCATMDIIVSMTLGRPAMLVGSKARSLPGSMDGDETFGLQNTRGNPLSTIDFFTETVKLYRIIGRILLNIYNVSDQSLESTEELRQEGSLLDCDDKLTEFIRELPEGLNFSSPSGLKIQETNETLTRQSHVLHVRTLHARVLLLQPVFLDFCRQNKANDGTEIPDVDRAAYSFARTCVEVADQLICSVRKYSATDATGAWWYNVFYTRTAAMVLLLSGVCPSVHDNARWQHTWTSCIEILTKNLPQYKPVKSCLATLTALRKNVLRERPELGRNGWHSNPSSGHSAERQDTASQDNGSDQDAANLTDLTTGFGQQLLDSTFDPFAFVESDLFIDFGFDFTQPLV